MLGLKALTRDVAQALACVFCRPGPALLRGAAIMRPFISVVFAAAVFAQQSSSTIAYSTKDGMETVEIRNFTYEVTGANVPGRPKDQRLVLRKTVASKQVLGDIGVEAKTTVEAWPLGADLKQKPIYAVTLEGVESRTVENALLVFDRGVEELEWWSVHKLGNGQHLFDTYVPLVKFSISREILTMRYVGLEVPPDDAADNRFKEPHVVAVLTYASEDKVIREALLTCDQPQQARLLRSYADESREVSASGGKTIKITFTQNYPSPPAPVTVSIPIVNDDLDLAHAQLPPKLHVVAWRR